MANDNEQKLRAFALSYLYCVTQDSTAPPENRMKAAIAIVQNTSWPEEAAGPISETPSFKGPPAPGKFGSITVEGDDPEVVSAAQKAVDAAIKDVSDAPPAAENPEPEEEAPPAEIKFADVLNEFKKLISLEGKEEEAKVVGEALVRSYGVSRARQIPPEKYGEVVDTIDELMGELLGGTPAELLIATAGWGNQSDE